MEQQTDDRGQSQWLSGREKADQMKDATDMHFDSGIHKK